MLFDFNLLFDCDLGPRNYPIFVQIKTESQIPEIESHFWCKNTMDYWAKNVKIVLDMQAHFEKKSLFSGEKSIKCPVF